MCYDGYGSLNLDNTTEKRRGKSYLSAYNLYICNEESPGTSLYAIVVERLLPIYFLDLVYNSALL